MIRGAGPFGALMVALGWLCGGCGSPELGAVPFLCNNGTPECPEGYECDRPGGPGTVGRCVKPGATPPPAPDSAPRDAPGPVPDSGPTVPDLVRLPDRPWSPDKPGVQWDRGPVDLPPPKPDGIPPHLGCQSNAECTSKDSPCCCPMPLVPQVWACLPLCLNPFCI